MDVVEARTRRAGWAEADLVAPPSPRRAPRVRVEVVVVATVVAIGVGLRFFARSDLWLDEALTVNVARLPLSRLPEALRHDGAPPLYYVLLHGWMRVFGTGDFAVRSLSSVCSVASLPLAWMAGRRVGGRTAAAGTLVVVASSPFAIRYATEARMYSLVGLLVLAGFLALSKALQKPTAGRLVAIGLVTAALLLSHYWAVYLLAATGLALVPLARRGPRREAARRVLVAMAGGGVVFAPWLPVFVYQARHTGTPWAYPPNPVSIIDTLSDYAGGHRWLAPFLLLMLLGLTALGVFGRSIDGHHVELDLRTRPRARPLAVAAFGTMGLAVVAGMVTHAGFVTRYTAVVFPLVALLAGLGTTVLLDDRVRTAVLAVAGVIGLSVAGQLATYNRTQARDVARAIALDAHPGDLVAYCPDQLGPGVSRVLDAPVQQVTYPRWGSPRFVDWVDYARANRQADPVAFAHRLVAAAGPRQIFLVWARGYRTLKGRCTLLAAQLSAMRPGQETEVVARNDRFERETLYRYPPP